MRRARRVLLILWLTALAACEHPVYGPWDDHPEPPPANGIVPRPEVEAVWIPAEPIHVALTRSPHSHPDFVPANITDDEWRRVVALAEAVFARSYIRVRFTVGEDLSADRPTTVHVWGETPQERRYARGTGGRGTINLHIDVLESNYAHWSKWLPPHPDRWTTAIANLLAHEAMHVIDISCPHTPNDRTCVLSHQGHWSWLALEAGFGAHVRSCIKEAWE